MMTRYRIFDWSRGARTAAEAAILVLLAVSSAYAARAGNPISATGAGESIYREGVLDSGKPLVGTREGGVRMQGRDAACINCHRHSGLGAKEGRIYIPPIAGKYLTSTPEEYLDLAYVESMRPSREPYTESTIARAIREGVGVDGKPLSYLMPRFALNDAEMASLIGYLKSLGRRPAPGVSATVLHFATIITPDADPIKRDGMLAVLNQFFEDKNAFPLGPTPRLRSMRKEMFMANRRWQLHVWQLSGPAPTWRSQLEKRFAREPVLAVLSGLAGKDWSPVHEFCERNGVPCLFPNAEAPPAGADQDFYSLYFSRGVMLEAGLIADRLLHVDGDVPKVVHQILRSGDTGAAGARALAELLAKQGVRVESEVLPPGKPGTGMVRALRRAAKADALVLWLRPPDIAALPGKAPPGAIYLSGLMGGLEHVPLPTAWRAHAHLAYPFALAEQRRINVDFAFGWFAVRHVPVIAEQVQADTFLACSLVADTLHHMADTFVPDYLVERIQDMIDERLITGYYPHLTLAPGQRFASKGGYIVRFPESGGTQLVTDGGWIVP